MRKVFCGLCVMFFTVSGLNADFLRAEVGAGAWINTPKGSAEYLSSDGSVGGNDTFKEDSTTNGYVWAYVKHPVPLLPNIRAEYSKLEAEGNPTGKWGGQTFNTGAKSNLDITQYDIIPYYNILDNTFWLTVDLGIDFRISEIQYEAYQTSNQARYRYDDTIVYPLGYLRARGELPISDIGIEGDIKYISYNGSTIYDYRIKLDYAFSFVGFEVGYRYEKIKIDDKDISEVKTDLSFSGIYTGVIFRF